MVVAVRRNQHYARAHTTQSSYARELDVLQGFLLFEDPRLPAAVAILHGAENDSRHLQARVAQTLTDCASSQVRLDPRSKHKAY